MRIGISTFVTDDGINPAVLGRALEERGFDSFFVAEHSHIPTSRESPYPMGGELPRPYFHSVDPFVALGAVAGVTSTLRLGTGITLLIQRDVIHAANEVASLDLISGGRVDFGVGVGWNREEMRNHGTDPTTRGALLDEQIEALKEIWTKDEAEYHGKHVDFDPIFAWPKPVQEPHPPIYIGGNSPAALARVARHSAIWFPNAAPDGEGAQEQLKMLAEHVGPDAKIFPTTTNPNAADVLDTFAEAGVERLALGFAPQPEAESLRALDQLVPVVERYR
ncbi:LLM class F420-dependent oxidoreductase [Amycolatopsis nigrescens]|uniref:LLM class F420-dependent oxidoreductase n=1 Tax=Amycolatopsis nigrescens TaxID=381445 RepID=UPI0004767482|nr:LLM class F420-dependent oxidoreductase [Amycolatopsis nigrescens]